MGEDVTKKGLNELIDMITNSEVEKIVILYKDRLVTFGYELIENLCKKYGTVIEIIDNTEVVQNQELIQDLTQIVTLLSYGLPAVKVSEIKRMIEELM